MREIVRNREKRKESSRFYVSVFNGNGSCLCGCFMSISVAVFCLIQWQNLSKSVMGCFDVVLSYLCVFNGNGSCLCGCFMSISVAVLSLYLFFLFFFLFLFVWLTKVDIIQFYVL